jgi:hypothetical protein
MIIQRITNPSGIDDVKIIGETEAEKAFVRQLAEAGTLTAVSNLSSGNVVFRAMPLSSLANQNTLLSRGKIGKLDFTLRQNANFAIDLKFISNALPLALNDYSAIKLQIKNSKGLPAVLTLTLGSGLSITGDDDNVLSVQFLPAQTALLCNQEYYYDLMLSTAAGTNTYFVEGKIKIERTVTS